MKKAAVILVSAITTLIIFIFPEHISSSVTNGIVICKDILLPSLFPFMIISSFISYCGAAELISLLFYPITKLCSIDKKIGGIWLATFIGGFPSGASAICSLYEINAIDRSQAEKLISCCICSGPAFLIIAVGKLMLNSVYLGVILFIAQVLSVIVITAFFCGNNNTKNHTFPQYLPISVSLVRAVNNTSTAMINIFSFVIMFSIITELVSYLTPSSVVISSLLEVTIGCKILSGLSGNFIIPISFLNGFGGVSVCLQILSIAYKNSLFPKYFWSVRFLNGLLCSAFCYVLLKIFPQATPVYFSEVSAMPFAVWSINSILGSLCFITMILSTLLKLDVYRRNFL